MIELDMLLRYPTSALVLHSIGALGEHLGRSGVRSLSELDRPVSVYYIDSS